MSEADAKSKKKTFCISQTLRILEVRQGLQPFLSGEQFLHPGHPGLIREDGKKLEAIWQELSRDALVEALTGRGEDKRFAVVTSAGLGKSTNLKYLEYRLSEGTSKQSAFFIPLDESKSKRETIKWDLPRDPEEFLNDTLVRMIATRSGREENPERMRLHLKRWRAAGKITLLLDSVDQAKGVALELVRNLLTHPLWRKCPMVISGRPHSIYDHWEELIGTEESDERDWRFIRIEPLAEEQRKLLLNHDGKDRYKLLPPGGRDLMSNPRNIEYVLIADRASDKRPGMGTPYQFQLADFKKASHLYAGATWHLIRTGFKSRKAKKLGLEPRQPAGKELLDDQIVLALDLLSALAYTMYCRPGPIGDSKRDNAFRPNVSHIGVSEMSAFKLDVLANLKRAGIKRFGKSWDLVTLTRDIRALAALNSQIQFDLLDSNPTEASDFRWYNRSLQEFFAARWLARHCDDKEDLPRLRDWRYDDGRETSKKSLYEPLWGFLAELPPEARPGAKHEENWTKAVGILFEHNATRSCKMIHRSWLAMNESLYGQKVIAEWRKEFPEILKSKGDQGQAAREIVEGFRYIPMGICHFQAESERGRTGNPIQVEAFHVHQWQTTNLMYEVFDLLHKSIRIGKLGNYPLAWINGRNGEDYCPVVLVSWFDAWCMAEWLHDIRLKDGTLVRIKLPTEIEWEYASRAGSDASHWFGDKKNLGEYAWCSDYNPDGSNFSQPVGRRKMNPNGLFDMYGNVWEWCSSRCSPRSYKRIMRGGSIRNGDQCCSSSFRHWYDPNARFITLGFRLAATRQVEE